MITPALTEIGRRILEAIINPYFLILIGLLLLLWRLFRIEHNRFFRITVIAGGVILILMSTSWLPKNMVYHLEQQYSPIHQPDPNIHWIVVLGGGSHGAKNMLASEALNEVTIKRLLEGIRLYKQLPQVKLILSGGSSRKNEPNVSVRMDELTEWFLISKEDRILESDSINTADEALFIKDIVHKEPFYLVTSAIHMPRSMKLFQHAGLNPIPAPCNYIYFWKKKPQIYAQIPNVFNISYLTIAWHEYLGIAWGRLRHIL